MGTLAVYTAIGSSTISIAQAQQSPQVSPAKSNQALTVRRFDIPAGRLEDVVAGFRAATGISVLIPNEGLRDIASSGVSGLYSTDQALKQLLAGTGAVYRFGNTETVLIELRGPNTSVEVVDQVPVSSAKYTEPLRDTPQTISVIPKTLIEEQGATTLRDVLRNVPGLTIAAGEGGVPAGDNLTMRGFSARNDVFVDGVRDLGPQSRDPFNLEQVEVVKGPQSAYTGRGSTGGSINMVSKSPHINPAVGLTLSLGTDRTKRVTGDLNTPVRALGERSAFRLNFLAHQSGVAGRNVVENQRWGLAPSLALGLATPTRVTVSTFHMRQDNLPDYGIPWVTATQNVLADFRNQPAPVPRDTFYGLKSRDKEDMSSDLATVRVEHDFSDLLSLRSQLRFGNSTRDSITTAPRFASNDSLVINRNGPAWLTEDRIWDNQTDLKAGFSTGRVEHSIVTGVNVTRETNERIARTVAGAPTTTLFHPDPNEPLNGTVTQNPIVGDAIANSQAVYAFDTVKLGRRFQLNGGLRWDRFDVDGINTNGNPLERVDTMLSTRAGAVYKPADIGSIYISYGTSLNPSLEGLTYQPADTSTEPEKTYTVEAGTKWDLLGTRLSLSGAVFRVEKQNARTPGVLPDDPPQVLDGTQRVSGMELGVSGRISRSFLVYGAYTYMDPVIVKSNVPGETGNAFQNTPRNSFSTWSTYGLKKLTIGGGLRFIGERFGNNLNTRKVDRYWTADAMMSYPLTRRIDLRLNLYNLNDAFHFDRLGGGHLIPGAARSAMVSTNFRF
jgi:catecholate siderophore receptor